MENLSIENFGESAILRVNRPQVLNALNEAVLKEMLYYLTVTAKQEKLKAVILSGSGNKAFIAGADIKEMHGMDHLQMLLFSELGQQVTNALEQAPFLTLAAVNGYALGGGLEMALACDFIYAGRSAKLGLPEVSLGMIPGFGGTQRLSRAVGTRHAKELIMSGKVLSAEAAKAIGIVNQVCEDASLISDCQTAVASIVKHSFTAVMQAKQAINLGYSLGMTEGLALERNLCAVCFATPERQQGMEAFLQKK
jgi:enoyl-CoA hydratase